MIIKLSRAGKSVIVISSEIEKLIEICDCIMVTRRDKIIKEFKSENYDSHEIIATVAGDVI